MLFYIKRNLHASFKDEYNLRQLHIAALSEVFLSKNAISSAEFKIN